MRRMQEPHNGGAAAVLVKTVQIEGRADFDLATPHALLAAAIGGRRGRLLRRWPRLRLSLRADNRFGRHTRRRLIVVSVVNKRASRLHARGHASPQLLLFGREDAALLAHAAATRAKRQFGSPARTSRSNVHFSRASRTPTAPSASSASNFTVTRATLPVRLASTMSALLSRTSSGPGSFFSARAVIAAEYESNTRGVSSGLRASRSPRA